MSARRREGGTRMHLYQLAMELDERSADVADKAQALGLGDIGPTTLLTGDQVATLRSAYGRSASAPNPLDQPVFTNPVARPETPAEPRVASGRGKKVGVFALGALAMVGAVAFFM